MWNLGQITFVVAAGIYGATDVGLAHALALGPARRRVAARCSSRSAASAG